MNKALVSSAQRPLTFPPSLSSLSFSSLSHPHLIKYYGAAQRGKEVFIVTEFLPGGTLADILSPSAPLLSWPLLISLARAAAEGLAALHTADVLHRDIKSENLLLDDDWRLVIADYGFARRHEGDGGARRGAAQTMTIVGTEAFMAPEVTFGEPYGAGADVFALGCVLAQIIVRQTPGSNGFLERTPRNKFRCDLDALRAAAPVDAPPSFVECAAQCLAYEPEDRLTAENAAEWLKELEEELLLVAAATSTTASLSASGGGSVSSSSGGGAAMTTSNHRLTRAEAPKPSIILANTRLHTASAMTTIISNEITTGDGDGDIN